MIRFLVRWIFRFVVLGIVLAVALVLLRNDLVKSFVEHRLRYETGMDVSMGAVELGLFSPTLTIADFKLFNRAEFGGSPFLEMPDLHLEYRPELLLLRKLRLNLVRLSVAEVNVVEGRDGRTNTIAILAGLTGGGASKSRRESLLGLDFAGIDTMNVSLGRLRYSSLKRPGKITEVKAGLRNEVFTNVGSIADARELVLKRVFNNGITITSSGGGR